MYRVYKDVIARIAREIDLYSESIAISVVDNVILVHNLDTKVCVLFCLLFVVVVVDSFGKCSQWFPVSLSSFVLCFVL
jgi:hypothetical protein